MNYRRVDNDLIKAAHDQNGPGTTAGQGSATRIKAIKATAGQKIVKEWQFVLKYK